MEIGVIACAIMRLELDRELKEYPEITRIVYIEEGKHIIPEKLKEAVREQIVLMKDNVDAIFLGYGRCQSLGGIEDEFDLPIMHPPEEDCIAILFAPERYREEVEKAAGTWFMTPGWAEKGEHMIMGDFHADRFAGLGIDPVDMARELFASYSRGLYIDTGVGDKDYFLGKAEKMCSLFGFKLEETRSDSTLLKKYLGELIKMAEETVNRS